MRSQECMQCVLCSCIVDLYSNSFLSRSLALSLWRARALSAPSECQKLAWKAGHKRECVTGAAGAGAVGSQALERALGMRRDTAVRWTAKQMRLCEKMKDLYAKQGWRGLAALEQALWRHKRRLILPAPSTADLESAI